MPLRMMVLGAATGIIALLLVSAMPMLGSMLPRGSQLAFVSGSDGNSEIYLLDVERAIQHNLTRSPVYEGYPFAWSPDGLRIAYLATDGITTSNIFVMDADGRNQHNLTNYDANYLSLSWSPDSRSIAFDSDREDSFEIFVVPDANCISGCEGNIRRVTNNTSRDFGPVWSPEKTQLLFTSYMNWGSELHVINVNGRGANTLTRQTNPDDKPLWSPDGQHIVFIAQDEGTYEIYMIDSACIPTSGRAEVGIPHVCESTKRNLSEHPADDWLPSWSPDGQEIVFLSWRDGNTEIYRLNVSTRALLRLTDHPADDRDPAWSPNGQWIAFVSNRDGSYDVYLMDAHGDNLRRLTYGGVNSLPAWRPW